MNIMASRLCITSQVLFHSFILCISQNKGGYTTRLRLEIVLNLNIVRGVFCCFSSLLRILYPDVLKCVLTTCSPTTSKTRRTKTIPAQ